jgi:hypothetical protein
MTRLTWMFGATPIGSPFSMQASYSRAKTGTISSVSGGGTSS